MKSKGSGVRRRRSEISGRKMKSERTMRKLKKVRINCEVREKTNKMQQLDVYYQYFLNMFRHHYAHLQENKTCVTARGVLRWFCQMWLVAVVGRCLVGTDMVKLIVAFPRFA